MTTKDTALALNYTRPPVGASKGSSAGLVSTLWKLGSASAQREGKSHLHRSDSHLRRPGSACAPKTWLERVILLSSVAGSFWNASLAIVLGDKVGQRQRKACWDGRRLNKASLQSLLLLIRHVYVQIQILSPPPC